MQDMLMWDPKKRPTASQALKYPYFQVGQNIQRARIAKRLSTVDKTHNNFEAMKPEHGRNETFGRMGEHFQTKNAEESDSFGFSGMIAKPIAAQGNYGYGDAIKKQSVVKKSSEDLGEFDFDELETSFAKSRFPSLKKIVS